MTNNNYQAILGSYYDIVAEQYKLIQHLIDVLSGLYDHPGDAKAIAAWELSRLGVEI